MRYFFFGLLRDSDILELVTDRPGLEESFVPARLPDARLVRLRDETFPVLLNAPGAGVPGVTVDGLGEAELERIRFFESVEYRPRVVEVERDDGGRVEALAFAATEHVCAGVEEWTFENWAVRYKAKDLREARLWMSLYGVLDAEEADRLWDEALAAGRPVEDLVRELCGEPLAVRR